uniref:Nonstructural protein n=1 Tax=Cardioderma bat coronavirus TaxID=3119326 RepID=A0AB38ZDI2_9NIDO
MFLGLFQLGMENAVRNTNAPPETVERVLEALQPAQHTLTVASFLLTSIFVVYFALFKASSFRANCVLLALRIFTLLVYVPVLVYFEAYLDGIVICLTLLARLAYLSFFCFRYKTPAFLLLNTGKLAFICGKYWYYQDSAYLVVPGGEHFVNFGMHMVPFPVANDLYVALRGYKDEDLPLVRRVELINGAFIYIFAREPVVGVVNMSFSEIQLYEDIAVS